MQTIIWHIALNAFIFPILLKIIYVSDVWIIVYYANHKKNVKNANVTTFIHPFLKYVKLE